MRRSVPQSSFGDRVVAVVRALGPGEVVSYGDVAAEAGSPGAARAVGHVLREADGLPWWRVVTATGRLAPGLEVEQAAHLRAEGVAVADGHVSRGPRDRRHSNE
ncbi:MGMT family protein [Egibacter rhizosphaerae]|uniref:MGMT family protein n=1 Tax=Egibacter rhizosphaerae TaxID=1670831 RepID=A0A411YEZ6_9ACTN|nr:MGMT family protein [Egibacter rhizosphaerae]QBI19795.1 MGMT family protein [Egibacter rhizosphaerae]